MPLVFVVLKLAIDGLVDRLRMEVDNLSDSKISLTRRKLESVESLHSKLFTLDDFMLHDPEFALLSFDHMTGNDVLKTLEFCARVYLQQGKKEGEFWVNYAHKVACELHFKAVRD
jgi:hypothetical protein